MQPCDSKGCSTIVAATTVAHAPAFRCLGVEVPSINAVRQYAYSLRYAQKLTDLRSSRAKR